MYHILFSKININHLAISYDNKLFIPVDVPGDGNCCLFLMLMSDRCIYLYCHLYKAPTTPCAQDIILNHFTYLEVVEELPTDSNRQIYYGDSRDNEYSAKIEYPSSGPSSSDDTFSLMVSPVSAPSPLDNQFFYIVSPYSMIKNSSQNSNNFDSSNVKDISGQKKRKLIINSNRFSDSSCYMSFLNMCKNNELI